MDTSTQPKGLFQALLDMSFTEFVTTKILKWLYILLLVLVILGGIGGVISGLIIVFTSSFFGGLGTILFSLIGVIIGAILARIWIELIMVIFRIAENTTELVRQGRLNPPS